MNPTNRHKKAAILPPLALVLASLAPAAPTPADRQVGRTFRVPYLITGTNHFLVRVRIDGKGPFNFLVDTGAPALFVGTEAAKKAGLAPEKGAFWTPIGRLDFEGGATLVDMKARVEDPFQLIGMNALGLPGASIDGILGFSALARFKITLDPTDDRMTWTRLDFEPEDLPMPAGGRQAPPEVETMNLLGPMAKLLAAVVGKQEPDRRVARGRVGVVLDPGDGPAKVASVLPGSPAEAAGIKIGDILRSVGGEAVDSARAATLAAGRARPGATLAVRVARGDKSIDLDVTAGEGL